MATIRSIMDDLMQSVENLESIMKDPIYHLKPFRPKENFINNLIDTVSWSNNIPAEYLTGKKVLCRVCGDEFPEADESRGFFNAYCSRECGQQDAETEYDTCELCDKTIFPYQPRVEGEDMHNKCAKQAYDDYIEATHEYEVNVVDQQR